MKLLSFYIFIITSAASQAWWATPKGSNKQASLLEIPLLIGYKFLEGTIAYWAHPPWHAIALFFPRKD